ncbi:hypothetical protein RW64_16880 [Geobacter sulfurreducens]|nr:hypothetical protein RW64_16880 [Geobacter sulfurreducens]
MVAKAAAEALTLLREEPGRYLEVSCSGRAVIRDALGVSIADFPEDVWSLMLESGAIRESEEWCSVFLLAGSANEDP